MTKKTIKGLKEIYNKYDIFFIDLWGVIHNGIQLYSGAIEVLENLYKLNKKFILMSNAPRPSKDVEKFLLNLKMDKIFAENVFTSGEAALKSLHQNLYGNFSGTYSKVSPKDIPYVLMCHVKNQSAYDLSFPIEIENGYILNPK